MINKGATVSHGFSDTLTIFLHQLQDRIGGAMAEIVHRLYVRKKKDQDVRSRKLLKEIRSALGIEALEDLTLYQRYDISGVPQELFDVVRCSIFSEINLDDIFDEMLPETAGGSGFAVEYLPGQYDQQADSAVQCIQLLTHGRSPEVRVAQHYQLSGDLSDRDFEAIKKYCINPVDSREADPAKPDQLKMEFPIAPDIASLQGFLEKDEAGLRGLLSAMGLAMGYADLVFCQEYFKKVGREPTETEIRVLDTYWSDHCRHTTFTTHLEDIRFASGQAEELVQSAFKQYLEERLKVCPEAERPITMMDIATMGMKVLRKEGLLDDLDVSEEINACSIKIDLEHDGVKEKWLLMFKNETHNHPTEIEPFGGAATCLGGAIRDPLSGRSWVYQAMRVTGAADPTVPLSSTIPGKLPQRKITREAAKGYSSYGNQIGLATGQVAEIYHPGYAAKRMEIGAVIAAAPVENVVRAVPEPGDLIVLVGGRTGRDGCGGATGSSMAHDAGSILSCGSEVQKGNPVTERKIQRLFRNPMVSRLIRRCNDFGAGGASVAIGELADSLDIQLDRLPLKYSGLDGTELAISESQERMAVVLRPEDVDTFIAASKQENLEATVVAEVTDSGRMRMYWRGKTIVDLERSFLNTHGVPRSRAVTVTCPKQDGSPFKNGTNKLTDLKEILSDLNGCSKQGLVERFDSSIGASSVFLPLGGQRQLSPVDGMVAVIPVATGQTETASVMTYGYLPEIADWSPFHGGYYAVLSSVAKAVALGASAGSLRLTFQEYFARPGDDPERWGKPLAALLGAYHAQRQLKIAAIGGKDSMSGTFEELDVPPTLVSFAVGIIPASRAVSSEFKEAGSRVIQIRMRRGDNEMPESGDPLAIYDSVTNLISEGGVLASRALPWGGAGRAVAEMCFGNNLGFRFDSSFPEEQWFALEPGSLILELKSGVAPEKVFLNSGWRDLGATTAESVLLGSGLQIELQEAVASWQATLDTVFPARAPAADGPAEIAKAVPPFKKYTGCKVKPRVFIPVFPGINCEYDTARAFSRAGAEVETAIFQNLTPADIDASVSRFADCIHNAQILMLSGGFSAGDEPDGSGKFISAVMRNSFIRDAVTSLLEERDGLILGICNGFQALIKLGLVPFGKIMAPCREAPTLTFNTIGRHVSRMVLTRIASTLSPWLSRTQVGELHTIPVSHGEGRFFTDQGTADALSKAGQIATQYTDLAGTPTMDAEYNPNGSILAVEGITSPDGRVFGKMGHSERIGSYIAGNVPGNKDQQIFEAGVEYFG